MCSPWEHQNYPIFDFSFLKISFSLWLLEKEIWVHSRISGNLCLWFLVKPMEEISNLEKQKTRFLFPFPCLLFALQDTCNQTKNWDGSRKLHSFLSIFIVIVFFLFFPCSAHFYANILSSCWLKKKCINKTIYTIRARLETYVVTMESLEWRNFL